MTNAVRFFNAREIRSVGGVQETREYLKMRWNLKQHIQSSAERELTRYFNMASADVDFITRSKDSVYGLWIDEKYGVYVVGTKKFTGCPTRGSFFRKALSSVIDMCEGFNNSFIVVYRPSSSHTLLVESFERNSNESMLQCRRPPGCNNLEQQIFCCCCNKNNLQYAFGCENFVFCLDTDYNKTFHRIKGQIHTITFDETGNLMATGVHTGNLICYDLRMKEVVMKIQVSESCLIDSSMINSNDVIVAGKDNVLCKVDIRMKGIVSEFLEHQQRDIKKAPLSIASNMLCATGSDNTIRIWDLSGGLPLHEIKPLDNPQNKIRGCLCNINNRTNFFYFEKVNKIVFQIL